MQFTHMDAKQKDDKSAAADKGSAASPGDKGSAASPGQAAEMSLAELQRQRPSSSWRHLSVISLYYADHDTDPRRGKIRETLRPKTSAAKSDEQPGTRCKTTIDFADKKTRAEYFPDIVIVSSEGVRHYFHKLILAKDASAVWASALADDVKGAEICVAHSAEVVNMLLNWLYRCSGDRSKWFTDELTRRLEHQGLIEFGTKLTALGLAALAYDIPDLEFDVKRIMVIFLLNIKLTDIKGILEFLESAKVNFDAIATCWIDSTGVEPDDYAHAGWKPTLTPLFAKYCMMNVSEQTGTSAGRALFICFELVPKDEPTLIGIAYAAVKTWKTMGRDRSLKKWLAYAKTKQLPGLTEFTYHLTMALAS